MTLEPGDAPASFPQIRQAGAETEPWPAAIVEADGRFDPDSHDPENFDWEVRVLVDDNPGHYRLVATCFNRSDAEWIAATSPDVVVPMLTTHPTPSRDAIAGAMQTAWNEWIDDTGSIPDAFAINPDHTVTANMSVGNWSKHVSGHLSRILSTATQTANVLRSPECGVLVSAVRYALTRSNYVVNETAEAVEANLERLGSLRTVIAKDIRTHLQIEGAPDRLDAVRWTECLAKLDAYELGTR